MKKINETYQVPDDIAAGLQDGKYTRHGQKIQDAQTGKYYYHLQPIEDNDYQIESNNSQTENNSGSVAGAVVAIGAIVGTVLVGLGLHNRRKQEKQEQECEERREELDRREAELRERERCEELDRREAELREREKREELKRRETELRERERALQLEKNAVERCGHLISEYVYDAQSGLYSFETIDDLIHELQKINNYAKKTGSTINLTSDQIACFLKILSDNGKTLAVRNNVSYPCELEYSPTAKIGMHRKRRADNQRMIEQGIYMLAFQKRYSKKV